MTKRPRIIVSLNENTVQILEWEADKSKKTKSELIKEAVFEYMTRRGWQITDEREKYIR